jgi:CheY-like chemotaxis protein
MDVMMPDMGGYDAVRLLYDNHQTRNIPVVVMTAQDFDASTIQLIRREPNVVSFLTKPFRPRNLRDIIKAILEEKDRKQVPPQGK